ncbi:MAG: pre-peptidase C-terminal domain-containing protein [Dehalococcoidia bacterium]
MRAHGMSTQSRLLLLLALAGMALALFGRASAQGVPPGPSGIFLNEPMRGDAAIAALGARLDEVAALNGKSGVQLTSLLRGDSTLWVSTGGVLFYKEPAETGGGPGVAAGPFAYSQTFLLHSKPGASKVIFLDFDGFTLPATTAWTGMANMAVGPYNTDGNAAFSNTEQDVIQSVWQRVAEDYAPFDVDVTTEDPGDAAITRSGAGDSVFGTRALITNDTAAWAAACSSGCGGIAYVGTFDQASSHQNYQPAFVFAGGVPGSKNIAEATSHEVGHNLGLSHDGVIAQNGQPAQGYYTGCVPPASNSCPAIWAPIMGVGYYKPISQWSRGEYTYANNTEDDLAVIQANGLSYRADDHGDSTGTATALGGSGSLSASGVISTAADVDYFSFTAAAGALSVTATPASVAPNLDILFELRNSAGTVLTSTNPAAAMTNNDTATGLGATISYSLPSTGTYYLAVSGVGSGDAASGGYSDYASLGQYSLSGTAPAGGGGGATRLGFTAVSTTGAPGSTLATQPVVAVQDANGTTVTGQPATAVTLSKVSGPGTLSCTNLTVNTVSGVANFAGCSLSAAGSYVLQATAIGLTTAQTGTITISAVQTATKLGFTSVSSTGAPGVALATQPVVAIQDANGNTVTSQTPTAVTLSKLTGPGNLTCTNTTVTSVNGVATFAGCSLSTAGTYALQATASGLASAQTGDITITAPVTYTLAFQSMSASATAGQAIPTQPIIAVRDANGNTVTNVAPTMVTLSVLSGPGTLSCMSNPAETTDGLAWFALCTLSTAGSYTLQATANGMNAGTRNITVNAPPAAYHLTFTSVSTTGTTGVALATQPTVAVQNSSNQTVTNLAPTAVTLAKQSGPGTLSCTNLTVNTVNGVASFAGCSFSAAGTYVLQATASGITTGQSASIVISAPVQNHLTFTSVSTTGAPGVALATQPTVAVQDGSNQTVTNLAPTAVTLSKVSGPGTLSCTNLTVNTVNGVASFAGCSLSTAGTYVLQATATGVTTGQTGNIVIASATPQLAFTSAPASGTTGVAFNVQPVVAVQDAGSQTQTAYPATPVTLSKVSGPGTLSCTNLTVNTVNGVATFAGCSVNQPGTYVFQATAAGITTAQSGNLTVIDGLAPPTNVVINPISGPAVQLSWTNGSQNTIAFTVYRWKWNSPQGIVPVAVLPAAQTSYTDAGPLELSTYYYYWIVASDASSSAWSAPATVVTLGPPPAAPANTTATATSSSTVTVQWQDQSTNELGFVLLRSGGGAWETVAWLPANTTQYFDTGRSGNTFYFYWVWSYGWNGANSSGPLALALTFP